MSTAADRPGLAHRTGPAISETEAVRVALTVLAMVVLALLVVAPLVAVFVHALARGADGWLDAVTNPEATAAIRLTLLTAAICVPLNTAFGIAAAWLIARYRFPGRQLLLTAIDLPFSVSPVICGMVFVLLFGSQGLFGRFLQAHQIRVIFAVPGIALATAFVTFPFVAREVLSVLEAQGAREEEAALTLGASTLQMLRYVTIPKIKWGVLYGVVLCNARAMGEFGAVSVVSGHIASETNTMPLHVELLASEYNLVGAFAVASLLALLALVTLVVRYAIEARSGRRA